MLTVRCMHCVDAVAAGAAPPAAAPAAAAAAAAAAATCMRVPASLYAFLG